MPDETLLAYLVKKMGILKAAKVVGFIAAWAMYAQTLPEGELGTVAGCARWWRRSLAQTYREVALFKVGFPDEDNPDRLVRELAEVRARVRRAQKDKVVLQLLEERRDWGAIA